MKKKKRPKLKPSTVMPLSVSRKQEVLLKLFFSVLYIPELDLSQFLLLFFKSSSFKTKQT